ncbi:MAG: hypothetical protein JST54_02460 [Deltaproteobacteria bacterium]|nr:hypothetical protein [Deltaproteobacteria bacterium]
MLTRAVKEKLADDVQLWVSDGLVSANVATVLRERYQASGFGLVTVIKYLGISGGVFCLFGVLGLISAAIGSAGFAGGLVMAVGGALMAAGLKLSRDLKNRYAFSSRAVTAVGALAFGGGVAVICKTLDLRDEEMFVVTGGIAVPLYAFLAYRLKDGFLLVLTTLAFFHWVGSWESMWGRSTYEMEVDQPKLMCLVAIAVFGLGAWHERHPQRFLRFGVVYQSIALVYLNLSLLILSISWHRDDALIWILVFTAAALAQIVLGAFLHNAILTGFGVTAAALDLFTRYFENFWEKMSLGAFLALGGAVLVALGLVFERVARPREGATLP